MIKADEYLAKYGKEPRQIGESWAWSNRYDFEDGFEPEENLSYHIDPLICDMLSAPNVGYPRGHVYASRDDALNDFRQAFPRRHNHEYEPTVLELYDETSIRRDGVRVRVLVPELSVSKCKFCDNYTLNTDECDRIFYTMWSDHIEKNPLFGQGVPDEPATNT